MRLSEKKRSALYTAISEPIMNKRIIIKQSENVLGHKNANDIDELLYKLESDIWAEVQKALNISGSKT